MYYNEKKFLIKNYLRITRVSLLNIPAGLKLKIVDSCHEKKQNKTNE